MYERWEMNCEIEPCDYLFIRSEMKMTGTHRMWMCAGTQRKYFNYVGLSKVNEMEVGAYNLKMINFRLARKLTAFHSNLL